MTEDEYDKRIDSITEVFNRRACVEVEDLVKRSLQPADFVRLINRHYECYVACYDKIREEVHRAKTQ
jgi:hypothetical protein